MQSLQVFLAAKRSNLSSVRSHMLDLLIGEAKLSLVARGDDSAWANDVDADISAF